MGISPVDFGKMSYGYFVVLCREMDAQDIRHHYPAAAIQATLCNLKRDPDKTPRPFTAWDFMPGWKWKHEEEEKPLTGTELAAFLGATR